MKTSNGRGPVETETPGRPTMPVRRGRLSQLWSDVIYVARRDKKWWLLPLIVMLLIFMALMIFAAGVGPLAPFIYPLL